MSAGPVIVMPGGQLAARVALAENWYGYDGAQNSPSRSFIYAPVQNPRKDLDRYTRYELVRKARYLYKNSPFIRGLIERMVTLTVGSGFHPVFKSSNPEWNKRAKEVWRKKAQNIHLGARCSFLQYQRAVCRARFVDGEAFSLKTSDDLVTFADLIQGLECDLIVGGLTKAGTDERNNGTVDGFNLNNQGVIMSYNVKGAKAAIDAEFMVHHFTPKRLGQYRGETILAAAINTAHDVDDILILEKQCVKDASGRKDIIKTASGQLDAESFRAIRFGSAPDVTSGVLPFNLGPSDTSKDDYYKSRLGAESVVLRRGDEYTPYQPDRPGSAWQGFMAFLANTICISAEFPPSVVLPVDVGGTDIRRDLDITQRVVEPWQLDMAIEFDSLIDYLLAGDVADGELKKDLPPDYATRAWHFPQKVNVDRQQAQQDRADVAAGLMSREEFHGRYSEDSIEIDATIIQEAKDRKAAIATAGFKDVADFVKVLSLDPKTLVTQPVAGQPPA